MQIVAAQTNDPNSLLAHYRTLIRLHNEHAALRVGDYHEVTANNKAVFASLTSNAAGGFDAYLLPELPANGSLMLQLQRRP